MIHPLGKHGGWPAHTDQEQQSDCGGNCLETTAEFILHGDILAWTIGKSGLIIEAIWQ